MRATPIVSALALALLISAGTVSAVSLDPHRIGLALVHPDNQQKSAHARLGRHRPVTACIGAIDGCITLPSGNGESGERP